MRTRALERGWSLNEYRFSRAEGRELKQPLPDVHFEADIYRALGLAYLGPSFVRIAAKSKPPKTDAFPI